MAECGPILVIEDDDAVRGMVVMALEDAGYRVLAGTRVPFDAVAALADEDSVPRRSRWCTRPWRPEAIGDALAFAQQVAAVA